MPHRRIIYYGTKNQRAATRYHNMKTVRLEREFFVPISTSIAALTPAQLIHKSSLYGSCSHLHRTVSILNFHGKFELYICLNFLYIRITIFQTAINRYYL